MKKKLFEVFVWIIFAIVMSVLTFLFLKYIDPIINPIEIELHLEDATIVVEKENGETITYQVKEDDKFYLEIERTKDTK